MHSDLDSYDKYDWYEQEYGEEKEIKRTKPHKAAKKAFAKSKKENVEDHVKKEIDRANVRETRRTQKEAFFDKDI